MPNNKEILKCLKIISMEEEERLVALEHTEY
jgi:hypothetical protein